MTERDRIGRDLYHRVVEELFSATLALGQARHLTTGRADDLVARAVGTVHKSHNNDPQEPSSDPNKANLPRETKLYDWPIRTCRVEDRGVGPRRVVSESTL